MSALASFGEAMRSVFVGTCVVGLLWTVAMLTVLHARGLSLNSSIKTNVVPPTDWFSFRHVVTFVAALAAISVVLVVGGLSRTAANGLATAPLIAFMWYVLSVIIDVSVTAAIEDTTSTQPEVHA